jgi:serine/threonine-protein kinase mTOR
MQVTAHPQGVNKKLKADENEIFDGAVFLPRFSRNSLNHEADAIGDMAMRQEVRNDRAVAVYQRVQAKLTGRDLCHLRPCPAVSVAFTGRDFDPNITLTVPAQVNKLIAQATSIENLCQCFSGWYVLQDV